MLYQKYLIEKIKINFYNQFNLTFKMANNGITCEPFTIRTKHIELKDRPNCKFRGCYSVTQHFTSGKLSIRKYVYDSLTVLREKTQKNYLSMKLCLRLQFRREYHNFRTYFTTEHTQNHNHSFITRSWKLVSMHTNIKTKRREYG